MNLRTACSPNLSQSEILIWKRTKENKFWAAKHSVKGIWCNAAVNMVLSHPFWNWHYIQNEHIICRNRILQIYSLCHCFIKKHVFGGGKFINLKKKTPTEIDIIVHVVSTYAHKQAHYNTAPFLLATTEFVWRSGACGSAVSIHHGSAAVGQFPIFPSLWAPNAAPTALAPTLQQTEPAQAICLVLTPYILNLLHWKGVG